MTPNAVPISPPLPLLAEAAAQRDVLERILFAMNGIKMLNLDPATMLAAAQGINAEAGVSLSRSDLLALRDIVHESIQAGPVEAAPYTPYLDRWGKSRTLADAYKPRPPIPHLIEGLLPLPGLTLVVGASGSHKSNLLIDRVGKAVGA